MMICTTCITKDMYVHGGTIILIHTTNLLQSMILLKGEMLLLRSVHACTRLEADQSNGNCRYSGPYFLPYTTKALRLEEQVGDLLSKDYTLNVESRNISVSGKGKSAVAALCCDRLQ